MKTSEERTLAWRFSSIEVGFAAAFGGLAFATRALGLVIPIGPIINIDIRDVAWILGSSFAGPWGGIIVGVLAGLPSVPPLVAIAYAPASFLIGLSFRYLRRPWHYLTYIPWLLLWALLCGIVYDVTGILAFWTTFYLVAVLIIPYFPICVIILEALRAYSGYARRLIG